MTYYSFSGDFLNCKKPGILFFLVPLGVLLSLCSCASKIAAGKNLSTALPYALLTDRSRFILLPPEGIENPMDMPQFVSASFGGQDYFFNAWVKADETEINMILVNDLGANMGELFYSDRTMSFSSPVFPQSIGPEYIVADFQLCFYSTPALRRALADCGLSIEETETRRCILDGKNVIIEIEKDRYFVKLVNHLRGYAYTLEGDFD
jgi:hypothetical protein